LVKQEPDLTLEEIQRRLLAERQHKAGLGSVWRLFDRHGISFKKAFARRSRIGLTLPRRGRHGLKINRGSIPSAWSSLTKPAPQPTWHDCAVGRRAANPHGRWKTTRFCRGTAYKALTAPCVIDGPMNGDAFLAYVEQSLAPTLKPGDIVVMDNLSSHKPPAIREPIELAGARLLCCPIRRTSTRSNISLLNSKPHYEMPQSDQWKAPGTELPFCSTSFPRMNAPTTSAIPAMLRFKWKML
jgi:hypothetical protein